MIDAFTIELPKDTPAEQVKSIAAAVKAVQGVEDAGSTASRGLDPQAIMLWIQAASGVLGVAATAVPLVQKVVEMIRGKSIKGAKIHFANGTTITADEITGTEIEALVKAAGGQ